MGEGNIYNRTLLISIYCIKTSATFLITWQVEVNENAIRHLFILNSGKFNFDYTWEFTDNTNGKDALTVTPSKGGVACGETQQISLVFCPNKRMSVRGCEAVLRVLYFSST